MKVVDLGSRHSTIITRDSGELLTPVDADYVFQHPIGGFDHYVFGDESGAIQRDRYFLQGVLLTKDPHTHENALNWMTLGTGYPNEIKYSSSNAMSLPIRTLMLEYFHRAKDLRFCCIVLDRAIYDLNYFRGEGIPARERMANYSLRLMLKHRLPINSHSLVVLDHCDRSQGNNLASYLTYQLPSQVSEVVSVDSKSIRLIQLTDLLSGIVFGSLNGASNNIPRQLIDRMNSLLERDVHTATYQNPKFDVWRFVPYGAQKILLSAA